MIPKEKIDEILQTARIEEVVGEFVSLKKSGASMKGLSPWTDEKTPSFMVSPSKQIFKDFSSGKGGNVVSFLMELEHFTYPEALRWLAKKYSIEILEEEPTPEQLETNNERESLYIINEYARDWFVSQLHNSEEGKNIGQAYFSERGFRPGIIEKFQLGYNPDQFDSFTKPALEKGYKKDYLIASGLVKEKNNRIYDGYKGRVIFPIHNLSGRVIGFGGRTLKADKSIPKYINTPENLVYDKSSSLYGIYFAKGAIVKHDQCLLVEGYTDVLSFHQKHIEHAVASSGTALTSEQVRLIKRYTRNILLVYDGDPAGIKASLRGINLILEEGMNVKVVLLPDNHDPDSFSKEHDQEEIEEYLSRNAKDFITFKAALLMEDAREDPIKLNQVIHDIIESIALVPDTILRSIYTSECSKLLNVSEQALVSELNKLLRKNHGSKLKKAGYSDNTEIPVVSGAFQQQPIKKPDSLEFQERDLLRLMVNYWDETIDLAEPPGPGEIASAEAEEVNILDFIVDELQADQLNFENDQYRKLYLEIVKDHVPGTLLDPHRLVHHTDQEISSLFIDLISFPYTLHDWERKDIIVTDERKKLRRAVFEAIYSYKAKRVDRIIRENQQKLQESVQTGSDPMPFLEIQKKYDEIKRGIAQVLGRTILH